MDTNISHSQRWQLLLTSVTFSLVLIVATIATLGAQEIKSKGQGDPADLSTSVKLADRDEVRPNDPLKYTIVITNSGGVSVTNAMMTDMLPADTSYVTGSLMITPNIGMGNYNAGTVSWNGDLEADEAVSIMFSVTLDEGTWETGDEIVNSAEITGTGTGHTASVTTTVDADTYIFLPIIFQPLEPPFLWEIPRPDSSNSWTVSWTPIGGADHYEIEEANNIAFVNSTILTSNNETLDVTRQAQWANEWFYRVRTVNADGLTSDWSNIRSIVGAYRDNFTTEDSGWIIQRTTFLEEVLSWYDLDNDWFIIQIDDKWDWGLASPLRKAPEMPYRIEMRSQRASNGNLISHGIVYAGDWNGNPCIELGSFDGIYMDTDCFNHFYNTNIINKNRDIQTDLKLLWERVDRLIWCLECGGSPMKRIGDDVNAWPQRDPIPNLAGDGWNTWVIEVEETGSKMYVNGQLIAEFPSDRWLDDPYFGVFASTDEYNNSTWRIDYFQVTPMDATEIEDGISSSAEPALETKDK